jgi:hypothetical protein
MIAATVMQRKGLRQARSGASTCVCLLSTIRTGGGAPPKTEIPALLKNAQKQERATALNAEGSRVRLIRLEGHFELPDFEKSEKPSRI